MFFSSNTSINNILKIVELNLKALLPVIKNGVDINILPHKKLRSNQQNKLLWEIYNHIVKFYNETGFIIDDLNLHLKFITSDFLHEYFKVRFNIKTTSNLNTTEFSKFIDSIQNEMIVQSKGEYQPIIPEYIYLMKEQRG